MKRVIFGILAVITCFTITGCAKKEPEKEEVIATSSNSEEISEGELVNETVNSGEALAAIREVLEDENWVQEHLYMKKTCFGEDASKEGQELTFCKVGEDKVIVQAYAYEEVFGVADTILSYQDGKVITYGEPSIEEPGHPGHIGYGVVPEEEILVGNYMHMGLYNTSFYQILEDSVALIASFESIEYGEDGELLQDENGNPMVDYTISINGKEESGRCSYEEYYQKLIDYMEPEKIKPIDIPFTVENIEEYLK